MLSNNCYLNNFVSTIFTDSFPEFKDKDLFDYLVSSNYFSYFVFQREITKNKKEHWQCYFELTKRKYFSSISNLLNNSYIENRKEIQSKAINYCKKEESRISPIFYEWGTPKENSRTRKTKKINHPFLDKIIKKIENNRYKSFQHISKEDKSFFWKNQNLLKNIWNEFNPVNQLDVKSTRVIWLFGEAGSGKSIWTKKFLRENNFTDRDIASISPQNFTYNDKIYFDLSYENKKVLLINEVDNDFPKYNNLISFIDRNTLLITKGSHIRNNFQLIIINSIHRPEEIFSYLGKRTASQILRRIFNPLIDCKVYEIRPNENQIKEIMFSKLSFSDIEFQDWYNPEVIPIPEPDLSLIDSE